VGNECERAVTDWHLGTTLTLQPQISNGFYGAANWVDAVEGARFQWFFTPKARLTDWQRSINSDGLMIFLKGGYSSDETD